MTMGLSPEEILESTRKAEERLAREDARRQQIAQELKKVSNAVEVAEVEKGDLVVKEREVINVDALDDAEQGTLPTTSAAVRLSPGGLPLQGGLLPFTGPLEDLFMCSASNDDLSLSSRSESPRAPGSPTDSVFDEIFYESSSSPSGSILFPESASSSSITSLFDDDMMYEWKAIDMYPNLMNLVHEVQIEAFKEQPGNFNGEVLQVETGIALTA